MSSRFRSPRSAPRPGVQREPVRAPRPPVRRAEPGAGPKPDLERAVRLGHDPARYAVQREEAAAPAPPVRLHLDPAAVQRLTGYEIEARIPIYGDYDPGKEGVKPAYRDGFTPQLARFLFGGLKYGALYGEDPLGHFTISADHNEIQQAHERLIDLLVLAGFLPAGLDTRTMSSIEYITPARDETGRSGKALLEADVQAVEAHAGQSYGQAQEDGVSPLLFTADQALTGVPVSALKAWIERHKGSWDLFGPAVEELRATINDQLYLQQTSGVLPQDLPGLYAESAARLKKGGTPAGAVIAHALELSQTIAREAWSLAFNSKPAPPAFEKGKDAVLGYLIHVANYLMADSLSLTSFVDTGITDKNLFALLPRATLLQSFQALPEPVRAEKEAWSALVEPLFEAASPFGAKYWQGYGPLRPPESAGLSKVFKEGETDVEDEEDDPVPEDPDQRRKTRVILSRLFGGKDPEEPFSRPLPDLDPTHPEIFSKTGQKGIAFEDRYFHEKLPASLSIKTFGGAVMAGFEESQARLLEHVPDSAKRIESESREPKSHEELVSEGIAAQRKRVQSVLNELAKAAEAAGLDLASVIEARDTRRSEVEKLEKLAEETKRTAPNLEVVDENEGKDDLSNVVSEGEDPLETARRELATLEDVIIPEQTERLEATQLLLSQATKMAEAPFSSELEGMALLKALHARALAVRHHALRAGHPAVKASGDTVSFREAKERTLNSPQLGVARKKKADIKPEELEEKPKLQVQDLLSQASETYKTVAELKTLQASKAKPETSSGPLLEIRDAGQLYVTLVNRAYEIYRLNRK